MWWVPKLLMSQARDLRMLDNFHGYPVSFCYLFLSMNLKVNYIPGEWSIQFKDVKTKEFLVIS